jgi:hypothetical protein
MGVTNPNAPATATDETLDVSRDAWFEGAPCNDQVVANENSYEHLLMNSKHAAALTDPMCSGDIYSGGSTTYYNRNLAFSSWKRLYITMGHELVHANQFAILGNLGNVQYSTTLGTPTLSGFNNLLELPAYTFQHSMQMNIGMGGLSPMSFKFNGWEYSSYFNQLGLFNMPWTLRHMIP